VKFLPIGKARELLALLALAPRPAAASSLLASRRLGHRARPGTLETAASLAAARRRGTSRSRKRGEGERAHCLSRRAATTYLSCTAHVQHRSRRLQGSCCPGRQHGGARARLVRGATRARPVSTSSKYNTQESTSTLPRRAKPWPPGGSRRMSCERLQ
jgi:hypothetical protein